MRSGRNSLFIIWLIFTQPSCASGSKDLHQAAYPPRDSQGLVFVIDGAGGFFGCSTTFHQTAKEAKLPLRVETYVWTHGTRRVIADHRDRPHARRHAKQLAALILWHKRRSPRKPIYLVSYSSGAAVALYTMELLPPNAINNSILLAPAVSSTYDLRRALRSSRHGIEAFYSKKDRRMLGVVTFLLGTADGKGTRTAGRVGFRPPRYLPKDCCDYQRLHQHAWTSDMAWTGYEGGHFDVYKPKFLNAYIFPLLKPMPPIPQAPVPPSMTKVSSASEDHR